jgi:urease gamma subunit
MSDLVYYANYARRQTNRGLLMARLESMHGVAECILYSRFAWHSVTVWMDDGYEIETYSDQGSQRAIKEAIFAVCKRLRDRHPWAQGEAG